MGKVKQILDIAEIVLIEEGLMMDNDLDPKSHYEDELLFYSIYGQEEGTMRINFS